MSATFLPAEGGAWLNAERIVRPGYTTLQTIIVEALSALAALKQDAKHFGYCMMVMERHKCATSEPLYRRAKAFPRTLNLSQ